MFDFTCERYKMFEGMPGACPDGDTSTKSPTAGYDVGWQTPAPTPSAQNPTGFPTTKNPTGFPTKYPTNGYDAPTSFPTESTSTNCHIGAIGDNSYCSEGCKCKIDEGDCDDDNHCLDGLYCATGVGADYICSDGNPCPAGRDFCQEHEAN